MVLEIEEVLEVKERTKEAPFTFSDRTRGLVAESHREGRLHSISSLLL